MLDTVKDPLHLANFDKFFALTFPLSMNNSEGRRLWMGCNSKDCYDASFRTVIPENSESRRSFVFDVRFKDFFPVRSQQGIVFMSFEARMAEIFFHRDKRIQHFSVFLRVHLFKVS